MEKSDERKAETCERIVDFRRKPEAPKAGCYHHCALTTSTTPLSVMISATSETLATISVVDKNKSAEIGTLFIRTNFVPW